MLSLPIFAEIPVRTALPAAERGGLGRHRSRGRAGALHLRPLGPWAAQALEGSLEPGTEVLFGYFLSNSSFSNFIYRNVGIHYCITLVEYEKI